MVWSGSLWVLCGAVGSVVGFAAALVDLFVRFARLTAVWVGFDCRGFYDDCLGLDAWGGLVVAALWAWC